MKKYINTYLSSCFGKDGCRPIYFISELLLIASWRLVFLLVCVCVCVVCFVCMHTYICVHMQQSVGRSIVWSVHKTHNLSPPSLFSTSHSPSFSYFYLHSVRSSKYTNSVKFIFIQSDGRIGYTTIILFRIFLWIIAAKMQEELIYSFISMIRTQDFKPENYKYP